MFEDVPGRLISGALWGLGAGLVLNALGRRGGATRNDGEQRPAGRPVAKTLIKAYVAAEEKVRQATAEARESLSDIYAEVQAERQQQRGDESARPVNIDIEHDEEGETASTGRGRRSRRSETQDHEA